MGTLRLLIGVLRLVRTPDTLLLYLQRMAGLADSSASFSSTGVVQRLVDALRLVATTIGLEVHQRGIDGIEISTLIDAAPFPVF